MSLGPFDITSERVEALGPRFTEFMNRLLDLERSEQGLAGHLLTVNSKDTIPDGGVDAATRDALPTDWLPAGDTAWQFKRSSVGPTALADELEGATRAHEFLRAGGSYVVALGVPLTDNLVEDRRLKIAERAVKLGLIAGDDRLRIRVYDANAIARWASHFPSLAVSRLSGGPGSVAIDFDSWSQRGPRQFDWATDPSRESAIATLRSQLKTAGVVEIRLQGESGLGKTRFVLEALRDEDLSPLVAYVDDERSVGGELLEHLIDEGRTAILVVDECPAERHIKLVDHLRPDSSVKLVTIGDIGAAATRTPILALDPMPSESIEEFLKSNYSMLGEEARRFVADHCRGNMRWTIVLADRVVISTDAQAADLIARNDIEQFVTTLLPEGSVFFGSAVLALLERVGWDRDLRVQVELLAEFAGVPAEQMEGVGLELERRGLMSRQGRYRSIGPHPLAVFLGAEAWRTHSERIIDELLPRLDEEMTLSLFRRLADLGQIEAATSVLPRLLSQDGPFSSLETIDASGLAKALTQLAIVSPDEVSLHLGELIEVASDDELRERTGLRRDLVWTLEKLVWHRRTFERAADSLLRLALDENETYANNATGTWIDLFGTMLPGTSATPTQRIEYLNEVAQRPASDARKLAVQGAARSLGHHESITVSGELQGGVLVEPRGMPATWGEAGEYRKAAISILNHLLSDNDAEVAKTAEDSLIAALHPMIDDPFAGDFLADVLSAFTGSSLRRLRISAEHLVSLYSGREPEERPILEKLQALLSRLPVPSKLEELGVAVRLRRWDLADGELQARIDAAIEALSDEDREAALGMFGEELPAAWELGHAFAKSNFPSERVEDVLLATVEVNFTALVGYLYGRVEEGGDDTFENFLDGGRGHQLDLRTQLAVAVRGPVTDRARNRILAGLPELPVADGAVLLFGWQKNLSEGDVGVLLDDWMARVSSERDYAAIIDWLNLFLHGEEPIPEWLQSRSLQLVLLRSTYPELSQQRWDWGRIAGRLVDDHGEELARLILDLVETGALMIHGGDEETAILSQAAQAHPTEVWADVARRLTSESWRIQMEIRGWLLTALPPEVLEDWIDDDVVRARIVASIAPVGGSDPTPIARFLLDKFGDDREVASGLSSEFISGFWSGPESNRIAGQIDQLNGWRAQASEPLGVRNWARDMIEYLNERLRTVREREDEERF